MKSLLVLIAVFASVSAAYGFYSPFYYSPYVYHHPLPGCRNVEGKIVPCARHKREAETPASTALPTDVYPYTPYAQHTPYLPHVFAYPLVHYTSKCKNNYGFPVPCRTKREANSGYPLAYPYLFGGYPYHYPLKYVTGCVNTYGAPVPCA
ncbi:uncharacterized protein [Lepeophtheirus salmonis]|nr:uncharacterized protein LOC121120873 [Lepeophtheirus salmonis]